MSAKGTLEERRGASARQNENKGTRTKTKAHGRGAATDKKKKNNLTHCLPYVTGRLLSNCSDTHVVQRSSSVGLQRLTHKILGDIGDPNSLLERRAGHGMQMWLLSNCSVTLTLRDKGCKCGSFPSANFHDLLIAQN